jgi:DNA-binding NarL/FixJ family response regulator
MDKRCPLRIFLSEPSEIVRKRISAELASHGMQVIGECANVDDCVAAILQLRPDVVVLDVTLRDGTGLQVLNRVRTVCADVSFIVCTNSVEQPYRERYLAAGAKAFLDKCTDCDQLPATISAVCCP